MSAAVRRLGSITPEAVVSRRASCGALNFSQFLEGTPSTPHRRRASIGPSEASSLFPVDSSARCHTQRSSLCLPDAETEQPSAAYLSRKRASLDNTWLTHWVLPNEALTKKEVSLETSPKSPLQEFLQQRFQNVQEESTPTINLTPTQTLQQINKSPLLPQISLSNQQNLCSTDTAKSIHSQKSPTDLVDIQLSSSPHCYFRFSEHRPPNLPPTTHVLDKSPDDLHRKIDLSSPYITLSPLSKSFTDCRLDRVFTHQLENTYDTSNPKEFTTGSPPNQAHQRKYSLGTTAHLLSAEVSSPKGRNGHRKRSSPNIVFPSLSPCIEGKTKSNQFAFDVSGKRVDKYEVQAEDVQEVSPERDKRENTRERNFCNIPKIFVDTVDYDTEGKVRPRLPQRETCTVSSSTHVDVWCPDLYQISPCLHCDRRRCSLETQLCNVCNVSQKPSCASQPSTPQPWQLQYCFLLHHRMLHASGFIQGNCFASNGKDRNSSLAVGSIIGRGGFGIVKLGCYRGVDVAVKVLKGERAATSAFREAHVLTIQSHVHLNSTYAVITPTTTQGFARICWAANMEDHQSQEEIVPIEMVASLFGLSVKDASDSLRQRHFDEFGSRPGWAWVVSDLCTPYTLLTLINDAHITLTTREKVRFCGEIASGLSHLHSKGLVHLDVKPANALLTQTGHLRLADFGCCSRLNEEREQHILGTVSYQAPEVLRGNGGTEHSDVFSLAITAWHLLTLTPPYHGLHPHVVLYQVTRLCYRPTDHHPSLYDAYTLLEVLLTRLIERCWAEDPNERPSAATLSGNLAAIYLSPAS